LAAQALTVVQTSTPNEQPPSELRLMLYLGAAVICNLVLFMTAPKLALSGSADFNLRIRIMALLAAGAGTGFLLPVLRKGNWSFRLAGGMLALLPILVLAGLALEVARR
jgi:hypothetical protein